MVMEFSKFLRVRSQPWHLWAPNFTSVLRPLRRFLDSRSRSSYVRYPVSLKIVHRPLFHISCPVCLNLSLPLHTFPASNSAAFCIFACRNDDIYAHVHDPSLRLLRYLLAYPWVRNEKEGV